MAAGAGASSMSSSSKWLELVYACVENGEVLNFLPLRKRFYRKSLEERVKKLKIEIENNIPSSSSTLMAALPTEPK